MNKRLLRNIIIMSRITTIADWWTKGGVLPANCIAAYQPKGSASYAASKINLANPGTYDISDGVAFPTWDAVNGWKFDAVTTYLVPGITPVLGAWSVIVRYASITDANGCLLGFYWAAGDIGAWLIADAAASINMYDGDVFPAGVATNAPRLGTGIYAMAGRIGYRNGIADPNTVPVIFGNTHEIFIGGINTNVGVSDIIDGYIIAMAIYDTILSADQVLAINNAMATL